MHQEECKRIDPLTLLLDDKAISFIQAEKLYYESVLIDDSELQKHIGEYYTCSLTPDKVNLIIDSMGAWMVHGIIHLNTNKVDLLSMSSDSHSKSMIHIQYQSFVDNVTDSHSISVIHIQCC